MMVNSVAVIGLGYVGLPLAQAFADAGSIVHGIDIDEATVASVNAGGHQGLTATVDFDVLHDVDAVAICVPTPLGKTRDPDLSFILSAAEEVGKRLHEGMLVVLESTTYPGTTQQIVLPRLLELAPEGMLVGHDFWLAFSPERTDPGQESWTLRNTPKLVGGITPACLDAAVRFYHPIVDELVELSSVDVAETAKLLENTYRAVNIALANEFAIMCERLGVDVWEVIGAAATKPYGFVPFYPGPGLGGHCIPIDPQYLAWKMRELDYEPRMIEAAAAVNYGMPAYVVSRVGSALAAAGRQLAGADILIVGVAYKADVSDTRESPALDVIALLEQANAQVTYHDPHVPEAYVEGVGHHSVPLTAERLADADCVLIMAGHEACDWDLVVAHGRLIVDTRNTLRGFGDLANVIRL